MSNTKNKTTTIEAYESGKYYFVDYVFNAMLFNARFDTSLDAKIFAQALKQEKGVIDITFNEVSK